jgi:hypothetical protein
MGSHHAIIMNTFMSFDMQFRMDYPNDPPQQIRKHLGSMGVTGLLFGVCTQFTGCNAVYR